MTMDWNKIADTLDRCSDTITQHDDNDFDAAIALCRRMAAGELVERSDYSVWLRKGKCELWHPSSDPADGKCVLRGTYEMCAAAVKAAPNGFRPIEQTPPAATQKPYGHDMRCVEGDEWLGPYGECKTDHAATPPAATKDEREHCERVAEEMAVECGGCSHDQSKYLLRERAQVREECQAEIDRLRAIENSLKACIESLDSAPGSGPLLSEATLVVVLKRIGIGE